MSSTIQSRVELNDGIADRRLDNSGYNQRFSLNSMRKTTQGQWRSRNLTHRCISRWIFNEKMKTNGQIPEDPLNPWEGEFQIDVNEDNQLEENKINAQANLPIQARPQIEQLEVAIFGSGGLTITLHQKPCLTARSCLPDGVRRLERGGG